MRSTGRTKTVCIRVNPELKEKLNLKQKTEKFNISEWFEKSFYKDYVDELSKLEAEKKELVNKLLLIDNQINLAKSKEASKEILNLSKEEVRQLVIACEPNASIKRQHGIFCVITKKKFTLDEFKELKKKYVYQG